MRFLLTSLVAFIGAAAGCPAPPVDRCPAVTDPDDADLVTASLPIAITAGGASYTLGSETTAESGAVFSVSKLKFYVTAFALHEPDGGHAHAQLVDAAGEPLAYDITLVDGDKPDSLALRFRAPPGEYVGATLKIGVPPTCGDGETSLNHADASAMVAPLDVDSDMYWSWDPGYVFLKVEGRVEDDGQRSFFYHVGEDARLMTVTVDGPIVVDETSPSGGLIADVRRLFVSPEGAHTPQLDGDDDDRAAHGGPIADQMKRNIEGSGFLRLEGGAE